jgi:dolichol-phosphate mannosyltransferase
VPAVSAFFPCYKDAATISVLVRRVGEVLGSVTSALEVIVVDDGSHDGSLPVLRASARASAYVRVVARDANRGYGAALLSGVRAAQYECVYSTDGDGQCDPAEVSTLIRAVGPATDIVQGWKISRGDCRLSFTSAANVSLEKRPMPTAAGRSKS